MNVSKKLWQFVWLLITSSTMTVFSADNLCSKMENYTITSMETYTEPVVVKTFTWCLRIPPRCPETRTEVRQRHRVKTETKSRMVKLCCKGYKNTSTSDKEMKCSPFCEKCQAGVCVSPNQCQCIPGYQGNGCEKECPSGTWGIECKEKCDCVEGLSCNPVNGHCKCPAGLQGKLCNEICPNDRWGPGCSFPCNCENSTNRCHPETGHCEEDSNNVSLENFEDEKDNVSVNSTAVDLNKENSYTTETTDRTTQETTKLVEIMDTPAASTSIESINVSTLNPQETRSQDIKDEYSSTMKPLIVLVSVPERRKHLDEDRVKFLMKNSFIRHIDDNMELHHVLQSKKNYVKNMNKDDRSTPISLDIALIMVASIVSLGLTSMAVVMVLRMRSKLLESTRISIYEEGKMKSQENVNRTKTSSMISSTLPLTPGRFSAPRFTSTLDPRAIMPVEDVELSNNYVNGIATIGLRLSGNLQGVLQDDHYDRPPSTRFRLQNDVDPNTEHVYDEIPLQLNNLEPPENTHGMAIPDVNEPANASTIQGKI